MKKITLIALVLCLALTVFAFASCSKSNKGGDATAASTTAPTAAQTTTSESTTAHVHTPASEYTIDRQATCAAAGSKSYHCTVCGEIIPETVLSIDKLDHTPEPTITVLEKATCNSTGLQAYICLECGQTIDSTIEVIPIDENAHKVENWSETPTLFNPAVHATGECTVCHKPLEEDLVFSPEVQTFTADSSSRYQNRKLLSDAQGEDHFYPTDLNPDGKDLLVEYTVLWNETLLNLDPSQSNYMTMRIASNNGTEQTSISYWSPTNDLSGSDCKYAGGFETSGGTGTIPAAGEAFTPADMTKSGQAYSAYPNLGGADKDHPEWGWHRVQFRIHQDVTNIAALEADTEAGATKAEYRITLTLYIDGVPVAMLQGPGGSDKNNFASLNYLYSAESDGAGKVVYGDNENSERYVFAILFNKNIAQLNTTAYWVDTDVSITCGTTFVQQVEKVATPAAATFTLDDMDTPDDTTDDVTCPAPIYFKLAD